jgi:hypothetical protein
MGRQFIYRLFNQPDSTGTPHYAIDIVPYTWRGADLAQNASMAKKQYKDEDSYRHDLEQDFCRTDGIMRLKDLAMLSEERAAYYGWTESRVAAASVEMSTMSTSS